MIHHSPPPTTAKPALVPVGIMSSNRSGWIKCTDRMPEDGQFFLADGPELGACVGGPPVEICKWDESLLWNEGGTEIADSQRFTHWMPLPSLPTHGL